MSRHGVRRERSVRGDVGAALADGRLVKVFAFRGSTQVMTPERAGVHLALRAASRMRERRSWQAHYGLKPGDWTDLREAVRESVEGGPRTPGEGANVVIAGGVVRGTWKVAGRPSPSRGPVRPTRRARRRTRRWSALRLSSTDRSPRLRCPEPREPFTGRWNAGPAARV